MHEALKGNQLRNVFFYLRESKNLETTPSQVIHKLGEFGIILVVVSERVRERRIAR